MAEIFPTTCRFCLAQDPSTRCFFDAFICKEERNKVLALLEMEIHPSDAYTNICVECENNIAIVYSIISEMRSNNKLFLALQSQQNEAQFHQDNDAKSEDDNDVPAGPTVLGLCIEKIEYSDEEYLYEVDEQLEDEDSVAYEQNDDKQTNSAGEPSLDSNQPIREQLELPHEDDTLSSRCGKCWLTLYSANDWNGSLLGNRFGCLYCSEVFASQTDLEQHRESCEEYQCGGCNQSFTFLQQLLKHKSCKRRKMHRLRNVKHLLNADNLLEDQTNPLSCAVCNEEYPYNEEVPEDIHETHQEIDVKWHRCDRCPKQFYSLASARHHRALHTLQKFPRKNQTSLSKECKEANQTKGSNECTICRTEFKYHRELLQHLETAHAGVSIELYQCTQCDGQFTSQAKLDKHTHNTHRARKSRYCCSYCGRRFNKRIMLVDHETVHRGQTKYHCDTCRRGFTYKSSYDRHMEVVHSEAKNFTCKYCAKSFKRKSTLITHVRLHTGEKPFECATCDFRCSDASSLRKHNMKFHWAKKGEKL
nr:zinc finger protein 184-like [Anopheles coluzzii]